MLKKYGSRFGVAHQAALDFLFGLTVFVVLALSVTMDRTGGTGAFTEIPKFTAQAHASPYNAQRRSAAATGVVTAGHIATPANVDMTFARTDQTTAIVLMAGIFSAVFAFNLAFYRHFRAVYAQARGRQLRRS